jgi:very-short-patch-repair endonuclease
MRPSKASKKRRAVLAERAHAMRHAPTRSEAALFRLLWGGQLGVQFKRQVPLAGRYIADLVAAAAKLVVEVDGPIHRLRKQSDARRGRVLRRLGYRVLRLEAKLVLEQPQLALARIWEALAG